MTQDDLTVVGKLNITLYDENGAIKLQKTVPNTIVTGGKELIAKRMLATPGTGFEAMSHMAVGTNSTTTAAGATALGAEISGSRQALTSTDIAGSVLTYTATFPAAVGTGSLTEAGIFNASSAGVMLCRTTFSTITKGANDVLTISWAVTIN